VDINVHAGYHNTHTCSRSHLLPLYTNILAQDPTRGPTPEVQVRAPTPHPQMRQDYPFSDAKHLAPPSHYPQTTEGKRPIVIDLMDKEEEMQKKRSPAPKPNASSGVGSLKMSTPPLDQTRELGPKNTSSSSSKTSTSQMKKMMKRGSFMTSSSGPSKLCILTQDHPQAEQLMYHVKSLRHHVEVPPPLEPKEEVPPPLLQIVTLITAYRDLISTRTAWVPWDSMLVESEGMLTTHSGMVDGPLSP
jgi:hypothetical protein